LTFSWAQTTWTAENPVFHEVASYVEIHWQPSDITFGGQSPTFFNELPPHSTSVSTADTIDGSHVDSAIIKLVASLVVLLGILFLACVGLFVCLRRRRRRRLKRSESTVPLRGMDPSASQEASMEMAHIRGPSAVDDPPPPYPDHEQSDDSLAPPLYQTRHNAVPGGQPQPAHQARPLSFQSEMAHDHALITDGLR
jgi:hypothetical protein